MVSTLEKHHLKNWEEQKELLIPNKIFDHEINETLTKLGIGSIEVTMNPHDSCTKNYRITFHVIQGWNINTLRVVYIAYAPCDKNSASNYHYYDGYHQDWWGLGDDWYIYSDTDYI